MIFLLSNLPKFRIKYITSSESQTKFSFLFCDLYFSKLLLILFNLLIDFSILIQSLIKNSLFSLLFHSFSAIFPFSIYFFIFSGYFFSLSILFIFSILNLFSNILSTSFNNFFSRLFNSLLILLKIFCISYLTFSLFLSISSIIFLRSFIND